MLFLDRLFLFFGRLTLKIGFLFRLHAGSLFSGLLFLGSLLGFLLLHRLLFLCDHNDFFESFYNDVQRKGHENATLSLYGQGE
jgi:hypothetical protein